MEETVIRLARQIEAKRYGKYRGSVTNNQDPEKRGRIRLRIPSVLGDQETDWALPCSPFGGVAAYGFFAVPEVDAQVWVEFEEGDLEFPVWVGTFWSKPGGESELPKPNGADGEEQGSVQDPPTRKIIKTLTGHTIQLEDKDGEEMIIISDSKGSFIEMKNDSFTICSKVPFTIDASGQPVEIIGDTIDFNKG